jgi:hypothetical protein
MPLAYASEAESRVDRINRRSHKLQSRLGDNGDKPKGMRWRTFDLFGKFADPNEAIEFGSGERAGLTNLR